MYELAARWLPPISDADKHTIMVILTSDDVSFGTPLLRKYLELLQPYASVLGLTGETNRPREADCAASGLVFFYGCLVYIMHFPNWGQHIEDIFLYDMLYILVDHYIDDVAVRPHTKHQAIAQMYLLIENPSLHSTLPLADPVLKVIAMTYERLLTRCPTIKPAIMKLFQTEIEGLSVQHTATATREQYYDIALRKGGRTLEVLQHIVGNEDPAIRDASYHIGTIMQLVDDCVDVMADRANGIHTIATHELATVGNLDALWSELVHKIGAIDRRFTMFIMLYMVFAVYLPDRIPDAYSEELRTCTNPLNMFDYNYGCDGSSMLVQAVMKELHKLATES